MPKQFFKTFFKLAHKTSETCRLGSQHLSDQECPVLFFFSLSFFSLPMWNHADDWLQTDTPVLLLPYAALPSDNKEQVLNRFRHNAKKKECCHFVVLHNEHEIQQHTALTPAHCVCLGAAGAAGQRPLVDSSDKFSFSVLHTVHHYSYFFHHPLLLSELLQVTNSVLVPVPLLCSHLIINLAIDVFISFFSFT